jgi:CBS domain-containing protein
MSGGIVSIHETTPIEEASRILTDRNFSAAPVVGDDGCPVGVLSRTDLVAFEGRRLGDTASQLQFSATSPGQVRENLTTPESQSTPPTTARDIMTPGVFSVAIDTPAARVVEKLVALNVHRLYVVDAAGVLVGVISAFDVLKRLK